MTKRYSQTQKWSITCSSFSPLEGVLLSRIDDLTGARQYTVLQQHHERCVYSGIQRALLRMYYCCDIQFWVPTVFMRR